MKFATFGDALDHLVVDPALDEDPRAADAALAGVHEDAHRRHEDGLVQVGVVVDQHRRLAAEFQHDLLEVARRRPHDLLADLGRPGEGDLLDVGMRGDGRTRGVAVAGQQVDDAVGDAGLGDEPVQQQRRERRLLSGLDDAAAAGGQRGRELGAGVEDRAVPREDQPDDAVGLLERVGVHVDVGVRGDAAGLHVVGGAVDLGAPTRVVAEELGAGGHDQLRLHQRHAGVGRVDLRRAPSACSSIRSAMRHRILARSRPGRPAQTPASIRRLRACHRLVDGLLAAVGELGDLLFGHRIDDRNDVTRAGALLKFVQYRLQRHRDLISSLWRSMRHRC